MKIKDILKENTPFYCPSYSYNDDGKIYATEVKNFLSGLFYIFMNGKNCLNNFLQIREEVAEDGSFTCFLLKEDGSIFFKINAENEEYYNIKIVDYCLSKIDTNKEVKDLYSCVDCCKNTKKCNHERKYKGLDIFRNKKDLLNFLKNNEQ